MSTVFYGRQTQPMLGCADPVSSLGDVLCYIKHGVKKASRESRHFTLQHPLLSGRYIAMLPCITRSAPSASQRITPSPTTRRNSEIRVLTALVKQVTSLADAPLDRNAARICASDSFPR